MRDHDESRPLVLILLPVTLEDFAQREPVGRLLAAPGVVAVDPPRVPLSVSFAQVVAKRQVKRLRLPGYPRAIAIFDERQLPLAAGLIERHPEAELWSLSAHRADADFTLDLATATDLRPAWERMERLGVESGRLGSERIP